MTKARLILVVPDDGAITREARTERRALYQAVADKIGAELLVAGFGTPQLLEVPLLTEVVQASAPGAGSPLIVDYHDARLPRYRDGVEGVSLLTDVVEPGALRRALLCCVPPLSLFALATAAAALGWWLGPLVMG